MTIHTQDSLPREKEDTVEEQNSKQRSPLYVFLYWILIMILLLMLVTATYTWFSLNRTPRVSDIGLYVNAPTGMVLSTAAEGAEWVHRLDYAEMVNETSPLRPVTWSEKDQIFYAAEYGADGRQNGNYIKLSDALNANRDDAYGYYIKATFYATSDTAVDVSLTHATEVEEGVSGSGTYLIGTPVWDSNNILHSDGGNGAQTALRIGLRITPVEDGQLVKEDAVFYIYEPNCDSHVGGESGYIDTPSIDGTDSLVPSSNIIRQTTTTWTEANPVQRDVVIRSMGDFESDTYLFSLDAAEIVQIELYVWLEGQDVDCDNRIGHEAQIMANVQFYADPGGQSGLEPIPEE